MSTASSARVHPASRTLTISDTTAAKSCQSCSTTAKASTSHLYAQQLNNSAALCIEIGHYSRAISSLQKALELNRCHTKVWKDRGQEVCKCYKCTLDACITFSENTPSETTTAFNGGSNSRNNKRRKVRCSPKKSSAFWKPSSYKLQQKSPTQDEDGAYKESISRSLRPLSHPKYPIDNRDSENYQSGGYIYRRPIRVSEGHAMGTTLYLIVIFNLALAHHLQIASSSSKNTEGRAKSVNRTLTLYELAHKWQLNLLCTRDTTNATTRATKEALLISPPSPPTSFTAVTSIRFNMMIRNNLSQIHRLIGNHSKHKRCLELLLSTVMAVTEFKSRTAMSREISNGTKDPRYMELDGFLQNVTPLILRKGHCADIA